jgi:hypothetical protein
MRRIPMIVVLLAAIYESDIAGISSMINTNEYVWKHGHELYDRCLRLFGLQLAISHAYLIMSILNESY